MEVFDIFWWCVIGVVKIVDDREASSVSEIVRRFSMIIMKMHVAHSIRCLAFRRGESNYLFILID